MWEDKETSRTVAVSHSAYHSATAPMLDESVIIQLVEMGFPMDACRKAVYYTGNSGAEAAMNWVMSHMDDPGRQRWVPGWGRASIHPCKHSSLPRPQILQTPSSCLAPVALVLQVQQLTPHQRTV